MTVYNKSGHIAATPASTDLLLWAKMREGNERALSDLYRSYINVLYKHGMYFCKDRQLVNDSIHELFSRLWIRRDRIGVAANVKVYLYRSLERIILAQLLRSRRHLPFSTEEIGASEPFEQLMIDGELRQAQIKEVKKCLLALPKCQREVILLKFFNDLSCSEISEIMNVQLPSVYNLMSKAIEQLRQKLQSGATEASS